MTFKSPLRYPGGKTRAIKTLDSLLPEGFHSSQKRVLAPFFGGGSFELFLTSHRHQVAGADCFRQLVLFWQQLLNAPELLAPRLEMYKYGDDENTAGADIIKAPAGEGDKGQRIPVFDKEDFLSFQETLREFEQTIGDQEGLVNTDDVGIAAKFYAVNRSSFSGSTLSGGFSKQAAVDRFTQSSIERVRDFYNPYLTVDEADFSEVLTRASDADSDGFDFIFLDPPYLLGGSKDKLYGDNGSTHQGFDHHLLHSLLAVADTPFMLTYNDSDEVRALYEGYSIYEAAWSYGMNKSKQSSEIVITNY